MERQPGSKGNVGLGVELLVTEGNGGVQIGRHGSAEAERDALQDMVSTFSLQMFLGVM